MTEHHLPGRPPVPLVLRRSGRARRISLRVSSLDGRVTLTLPPGVPESEALDFAASRAGWIRKHLAGLPGTVRIEPGALLPIEGHFRSVEVGEGRSVTLLREKVRVPARSPGPALRAFLRDMARDRLAAASDRYAAALGRSYTRLTLRDPRSRWGSCSSQGGLMYSWRLILAPAEVLDYVAAHEVAHLAEMNHSAAFWATVERLYGPYALARRWLRENGPDLHRYRFDD